MVLLFDAANTQRVMDHRGQPHPLETSPALHPVADAVAPVVHSIAAVVLRLSLPPAEKPQPEL